MNALPNTSAGFKDSRRRDPRAGVAMLLLAAAGLLAWSGCDRSQSPGGGQSARPTAPAGASLARAGPSFGRTGANVLLVSVDTTRADHLGCYGHPTVKTPRLDQLAAEGTRFAWCISAAPLTLTSHATMLTGSTPYVHGARDNTIYMVGDDNVLLSELLKQAGYVTSAVLSASVMDAKYGLSQGFDSYIDVDSAPPKLAAPKVVPADADLELEDSGGPRLQPPEHQVCADRKAEETTDYGIELLTAAVASGRPFFIFLHYFDPHWPHEAPPRFVEQYQDGYFAEIAYFDEQFGRLMDSVRSLGLGDDTLVILTSDHGEGRGQHDEYTHSNFLYDTTLHVPLIFWQPGQVPAGAVVETQVRLLDLASTIVEWTRLSPTPQMQGTSLLPLLADPALESDLPCYSDSIVAYNMHGFSPLRSLRAGGWKYILAPKPELYHVAEDGLELFDKVDTEPQRAAEMRQQLWDYIAASPPAPGNRAARAEADPEDLQKLQALGYVGAPIIEAENDRLLSGSELDHFEPVGANPKDYVEAIECLATGMGAFRVGQYDFAERILRRVLELTPDNSEALGALASTVMALERYDEALELFRRAIELNPEKHEYYATMAVLSAMRGDFAEAEAACHKAIALAPDNARGHFELGRALSAQGRYEEALKSLSAAAAVDPKAAIVRLQLGMTHRLAGNLAAALEALDEALRLNPALLKAHTEKARVLCATDQVPKAIEGLEQTVKEIPNEALLYNELAACYIQLGDREKAGQSLARVLELAPESAVALRNLAANLKQRGKLDEAIEHLREAIKLKPTYTKALGELANLLEVTGKPAEALQTFEQLVEAAPDQAEAYRGIANLLDRQGRPDQAVDMLRKGRAAAPGDALIANDLAWRLATNGDEGLRNAEEAVALASEANALAGGKNVQVLDTLAAAYAAAGRFAEAITTAGQAIELAKQANAEALADRITARRSLYEQGRPYHEQ